LGSFIVNAKSKTTGAKKQEEGSRSKKVRVTSPLPKAGSGGVVGKLVGM